MGQPEGRAPEHPGGHSVGFLVRASGEPVASGTANAHHSRGHVLRLGDSRSLALSAPARSVNVRRNFDCTQVADIAARGPCARWLHRPQWAVPLSSLVVELDLQQELRQHLLRVVDDELVVQQMMLLVGRVDGLACAAADPNDAAARRCAADRRGAPAHAERKLPEVSEAQRSRPNRVRSVSAVSGADSARYGREHHAPCTSCAILLTHSRAANSECRAAAPRAHQLQ